MWLRLGPAPTPAARSELRLPEELSCRVVDRLSALLDPPEPTKISLLRLAKLDGADGVPAWAGGYVRRGAAAAEEEEEEDVLAAHPAPEVRSCPGFQPAWRRREVAALCAAAGEVSRLLQRPYCCAYCRRTCAATARARAGCCCRSPRSPTLSTTCGWRLLRGDERRQRGPGGPGALGTCR